MAVFGHLAHEDQKLIKGFQAEAGPTEASRASRGPFQTLGPASAGKASVRAPEIDGERNGVFPAKAGPTYQTMHAPCRTGFSREAVAVDLLRESSDTAKRDVSEGILTKEGRNQERASLVTREWWDVRFV